MNSQLMRWVGATPEELEAAQAILATEFTVARRCVPHRRLPQTFVSDLHGHVLDGTWHGCDCGR
jgi:hypothetical protein